MLTKEKMRRLFSVAAKHYPAPWKAAAAEELLDRFYYLRDADGRQIATFCGLIEESAAALRLIREVVNDIHEQVEADKPQEAAVAPAAESV